MTRGLKTLAAAALVLALHLAALVALTRMAPDMAPLREGPVFEIVLAKPRLPARRPSPSPADSSIRWRQTQVPAEARGAVESPGVAPPVVTAETEAQAARLRAALRQTFGCSQPDVARLNEAERDACLARFAQGAESATYRPPQMDPDKQQALRDAASRKAADRAYRESTTPPLGIDTTSGGPVMRSLPDL